MTKKCDTRCRSFRTSPLTTAIRWTWWCSTSIIYHNRVVGRNADFLLWIVPHCQPSSRIRISTQKIIGRTSASSVLKRKSPCSRTRSDLSEALRILLRQRLRPFFSPIFEFHQYLKSTSSKGHCSVLQLARGSVANLHNRFFVTYAYQSGFIF